MTEKYVLFFREPKGDDEPTSYYAYDTREEAVNRRYMMQADHPEYIWFIRTIEEAIIDLYL